jgi:hypothetical protein
MRIWFAVVSTLLLVGSFAVGQNDGLSSRPESTTDTSKTKPSTAAETYKEGLPKDKDGNVQITGCLNKVGGDFIVAAENGLNFRLEGNKSRLDESVGQKVTVTGERTTGQTSPSTQTGMEMGSGIATGSNAGSPSQITLNVKNIRMLSGSCGRESGAASGSTDRRPAEYVPSIDLQEVGNEGAPPRRAETPAQMPTGKQAPAPVGSVERGPESQATVEKSAERTEDAIQKDAEKTANSAKE